MSKNNYWVLLLKGEKPEILTSWPECEKKKLGASRAIDHGFPTEEEAMKFIAGEWRGKPISGKAEIWLKEYRVKAGQLKRDTELDKSKLFLGEYPNYCAYVDGSYNKKTESYGFGVVYIYDGKIETFYGGGKEKDLADKGCAAGELLACMEAIKHAVDLGLPKLTIIYDSQLIQWAYYGCGDDMLTQAAGQYIYDIRDKMGIEVESIEGRAHEYGVNSAKALADKCANVLADKLARKGAGIVD